MTHCQIHIQNKHYDNETILEELSFEIKKDEFLTIIGPSGVGKSTLLNIIVGIDEVYDGQINFNIAEQTISKMAYVFQEPRLIPWLTVYENINIVLSDAITKTEKQEKISALLDLMDLQAYSDSYPGQLSGGMQRRVGLARAFIVEPELLLLDEPFVSLDKPTAESLRSYLKKIWNKKNISVLFITHDLHEAIELSDRILFLSKKPANIIYELYLSDENCNSSRDRNPEVMSQRLLNQYPCLLEGIL